MPIQTNPVQTLNLVSIKKAIQTLSKQGKKLTNVTAGGNSYVSSQPVAGDIDEGSEIYWNDSGTMKKVEKIGGTLYYTTLTAL